MNVRKQKDKKYQFQNLLLEIISDKHFIKQFQLFVSLLIKTLLIHLLVTSTDYAEKTRKGIRKN